MSVLEFIGHCGAVWLSVAVPTALLLGAGIRLADQRRPRPLDDDTDVLEVIA